MENTRASKENKRVEEIRLRVPCATYYTTRGYVKPKREVSAAKEDAHKMKGVD